MRRYHTTGLCTYRILVKMAGGVQHVFKIMHTCPALALGCFRSEHPELHAECASITVEEI